MATSNEMMRPVILSRPENTAVGLAMRCGGGSTTTSSLGCGSVLAGCGALRGEPGPGGKAGGGAAVAPCCGGWAAGGAAQPPGGGGSGCDWMPPAPGRVDGGNLMGAGSGCGGGVSRAPGGGCCGCCGR